MQAAKRYIGARYRQSIPQASPRRASHSNNANPFERCFHFGCTATSCRQRKPLAATIPSANLHVRMVSTPAAALTSQNVVLPFIQELTDPKFLDILVPAPAPATTEAGPLKQDEAAKPTNPFVEALKGTTHRTLTKNDAMAYDSTMDPILDAFYAVRPSYHGTDMWKKLDKAWAQDRDTTLKIIWNARSIHDGKGERETFYQAWAWLYKRHPRTAIENLPLLVRPVCKINKAGDLASHGYWKDLLNLVCLDALDQLGPVGQTFLHHPKTLPRWKRHPRPAKLDLTAEAAAAKNVRDAEEARARRVKRRVELHDNLTSKLASDPHFRALYIAVARLFAEQLVKDVVTLDRIDALPSGPDFAQERRTLSRQVSLAGRWAPTPGCTHDMHTNIATAVAQLIHFSQAFPTPGGLSVTPATSATALEAHILRAYYQRWVLRPLRAHIHCPEPLMSSGRWKEIRYTRVPSACMSQNMPHFYVHDPEGFELYLSQVESGKKKISGATLMPHSILKEAMSCHNAIQGDNAWIPTKKKLRPDVTEKLKEAKKKLAEAKVRTVEAQWRTMVERVKEAGKLENALAVCDVSGSMGSLSYIPKSERDVQPIWPAVSLSLLLAQIAQPPFNNGFITFSATPEYVQLDPSVGLGEMATTMQTSAWTMNTNFEAVFLNLLLPLAKQHHVKPEDMVKRLFVFSDMQFDASRSKNHYDDHYTRRPSPEWETSHDVIEKAYKEAGYEVPEIVYWNLAGEVNTTPVTGEKKGVALMSGFSQAMLKVFLGDEEAEVVEKAKEAEWEDVSMDGEKVEKEKDEDEEDEYEFTPLKVMMKALNKASYDGLVVVD